MVELFIEISWNGITALEIVNGDNIKYFRTFYTWHELIASHADHMKYYASIHVRRILPTDLIAYPIEG